MTGLELLKDIGEQVTDAASQAGHTINDIFGISYNHQHIFIGWYILASFPGSKGLSVHKFTKPYSHLGNITLDFVDNRIR